jgi:putative transposase
MPTYRRLFTLGGCWFFTHNLANRRSRLLVEHIDLLRQATLRVQQRLPFDIDAEVVLPDHLHAIWTLPPGDQDFPSRWRLIKTHFSKALPNTEWREATRRARGERGIWQRRYWEHLIASEADWSRHVDYCYFNPVKHGWVARVEDWPHSTFHRDKTTGFVPTDWDAAARVQFGERE